MSDQAGETAVYHIIYASSAVVRLSQNQLLDLLKISRVNNEARSLSGMLLYRDGLYLQLLEGSRDEITKLLIKLRKDPRHTDIRVLRQGELRKRLFPEWSMAYKNLVGLKSSVVPGYSEQLQGYFKAGSGKDPADLLTNMFTEFLATREA
jgi:hypothetical protein